jgi:DNA polymerase zeta
LVKGVHFYGFHASYTPFLKVHLADPALISRAAAILRTGTVMGTRFRVFESHISYVLQFMCDFNLYGCGSLDLGEVWERASSDPIFTQTEDDHVDHFQPSSYLRQTRMPLEVDVAAHQILNRHRLTARNLHHELKIPAATPPSEPLVASVRELWDDERRRRVARGLPPSPDIPVDPSERSRAAGGDWVQEAAFWDNIRARIQLEGETEPPPAAAGAWERWVMTTFESIEALWEDEHKTWKPARDDMAELSELKKDEQPEQLNPFETMTPSPAMLDVTDDQDDVDVDETTLATQAVEQFIDQEQDWDIHAIRRERNADQDIGEDVAAHEDEDELTSTPRKIAGSALGSPKKTPSKRPFPVSQPSTPFRERSYLSSRGTPSKPANRFVNAFGQLAA